MTINVQAFRILYRATQACPSGKFDMRRYAHPCGTPACLLGNYAASPEQDAFVLSLGCFVGSAGADGKFARTVFYADCDVYEHFGISYAAAYEMFGEYGAGGTGFDPDDDSVPRHATKAEALAYIRAFCAERGVDVTTE